MNRLDGKVALISGAARGIGGETAKRMAEAGAKVVIGDILEDKAGETVKEITATGGQALFVKLDVSSEASWSAALSAATKQFSGLDILVNNAGMFLGRDFMDATMEDWNKLVAINMTGVSAPKCALPRWRSAAPNQSTARRSSIWRPLPVSSARSSIRSTR